MQADGRSFLAPRDFAAVSRCGRWLPHARVSCASGMGAVLPVARGGSACRPQQNHMGLRTNARPHPTEERARGTIRLARDDATKALPTFESPCLGQHGGSLALGWDQAHVAEAGSSVGLLQHTQCLI
ncbi:hypothetical protein NDU88_007426 [Pleurodeles waltl]|uniref:Uncharacterized protein n=1 Tax=Pleurodeles waltl TaxID=8319 RepID=A0AAV7LZV1_PLEWA|nr:hypothetical protein NDU88_007426 [Pleurodeles waltl]